MKYLEIKVFNNDPNIIEMIKKLEIRVNEIVEYFGINDFKKKINLTIFSDINDFRNAIEDLIGEFPKPWVNGMSITKDDNRYIFVLTVDQTRKLQYHENFNIDELQKLILHEFVHSCQSIVSKKHDLPLWLCEGQAIYLSKQSFSYSFNVSYDEMVNGQVNYNNYFSMFKYVLNKYGKNYTMDLIRNEKLRNDDGKRLYHEAGLYYKKYFESLKQNNF